MDRQSWSRQPWDVDPRFTENLIVSEHNLQSMVRHAAELQTRLDAAQRLLLRRGIVDGVGETRAA